MYQQVHLQKENDDNTVCYADDFSVHLPGPQTLCFSSVRPWHNPMAFYQENPVALWLVRPSEKVPTKSPLSSITDDWTGFPDGIMCGVCHVKLYKEMFQKGARWAWLARCEEN